MMSSQTGGLALEIVSYIGLAISLACLLLTIIFFLSLGSAPPPAKATPTRLSFFTSLSLSLLANTHTHTHTHTHRKKLFSAVHNFVHLNLAISLFIGYLIFAVGVELAKNNEVGACPLLWGVCSLLWGACPLLYYFLS